MSRADLLRPLRLALTAAGLVLAAPAVAQMPPGMAANPMMPGGAPVMVLTDARVEGFIASYPALKAKMDEMETKYDLPKTGGDSPADAWQAMAAYRQASAELDGAVAGYGFASYGEWVQTAMAIAMAHAFAREGGDMDSQLAETIARVQGDPNIPDGQKQVILQQLQLQSQMMSGIRPPKENVETVGRFGADLDRIFKEN